MGLLYTSKNAAVAVAGTTFAHGLLSGGANQTPDEWSFNHRGAPPAAASQACTLYLASVGSTNLVLASSSGATTADVFARITFGMCA